MPLVPRAGSLVVTRTSPGWRSSDVDDVPLLAARAKRPLIDLELQGLESQFGVSREGEELGKRRLGGECRSSGRLRPAAIGVRDARSHSSRDIAAKDTGTSTG